MNPLPKILRRLRALFLRHRLEDEMNAELRFHLEMQEAANRAAGLDPDEAHFAARRQFGHLDGVKESMRDLRGWVWLEQLGRDFRFALRALARSRGFLVAAVPTLACGIGLCTTIFSVVNPILFRPLPFPEPDQLVFLNETSRMQGVETLALSYADYLDWRRQNRVFSDLGLFLKTEFTLHDGDHPERIPGGLFTASLLTVLGTQPALGRGFTEADEPPDAPPVVLISHAFWEQRFGSDPEVLGRSLALDNRRWTVVGVMPPGFSVPDMAQLWLPVSIADPAQTRGSHSFQGIGRLKPGMTIARARADLAVICERIAKEFPAANTGVGASVTPLREQFLGRDRLPLMSWLLLGAVGFVLAIACANVANLFLARALGRQKEFAVRAAFGASRWRTIRQLLTESLLVAAAAGALGFALSLAGVHLVLALVPVEIPPWIQFGVDYRVGAVAVGASVLSCVLFGLAPAWRISGTPVQDGLDEAGRGLTENRRHSRLRALLVVTEVALASLLLCGAGMMIQTVINLQKIDPGFEPAGLAAFDLDLPPARYGTPAACVTFYRTLLEKVGALEGVEAAAAVSHRPISPRNYVGSFYVTGRPAPPPGRDPVANFHAVTPGYFATMGIPVLQGRDFSPADGATAPLVVIIDRHLARRYFPDSDPVGQHIQWGREASAPRLEIIGVVGPVKHYGLQDVDAHAQPGLYLPHAQAAFNYMTVVARLGRHGWPAFAPGVRGVLRKLDGALPWTAPQSMEEILRQSVWTHRLLTTLLGAFSALALALTAVGIAGMVAYTVAQRTHEIGVRMALGARGSDVIRLVMRQAMRFVAWGLGFGLAASAALSWLLAAKVFPVRNADPATLAVSACLFGAVALLACYLPARRATRVDPLTALRAE